MSRPGLVCVVHDKLFQASVQTMGEPREIKVGFAEPLWDIF